MSIFSRRKFLSAALAAAACGGSEMAPVWTPKGIGPFDPRQPKPGPIIKQPPPKREIYTQQPIASPIHLSSSLVLRSGSNGTVAAAAMKNPMGQDMELLEIKFELSGAYDAEVGGSAPVFGGTIWCELMMGNVKITNGAIPVWCFGRAENLEAEGKTDSTDSLAFMSYSWRLPRPLFIPAGAVVIPNFTHTGFVPDTINVRVGYSARTVFKRPRVVYVPWVAKYVSKSFNPLSAADVDASSELDLVNPHPEVLHLQRMVGRNLAVGADATFAEGLPMSFGSQFLKLRITDSYGRPIVRSFTPFVSVFDAGTRSWEMDNGAELDPGAYYLVNLKKDATVVATAGGAAQAFISIIGWRELENP